MDDDDEGVNPWAEGGLRKAQQEQSKSVLKRQRLAMEKSLPQGRRVGSRDGKVPPGQALAHDRPVLDLGQVPKLETTTWQLSLQGEVANPMAFDWHGLQNLPQHTIHADIHCVTGWSRLGDQFDGIMTSTLRDLVQPKEKARFVLLRSYDGYSTNLTIEDFFHPQALLATHWNKVALEAEHGGPLRLVLPHLYFWKSAKWVRQIIFRPDEIKGYWELRGYHNRGNPWKQERFS